MVTQVVILVGGPGTRLNDHVRFNPAVETPKPLIEVGGKPFVTYAINQLKGVGISDIVLLVGYMKESYGFLEDKVVRLVDTKQNFNEAVLSIPDLKEVFILLNGDCFPIMGREDWKYLLSVDHPVITVKIIDRDAGMVVVTQNEIKKGSINCERMGDMRGKYEEYCILGGLHIGTYQGLERAR